MKRRDLVRMFGAATALALAPSDAMAAWARVASGIKPVPGLPPAGLAVVDAIADTLIPRTDTPGASDVNVTAFVDVIVSENYDDAERDRFSAGIAAIQSDVRANGGVEFVELDAAGRGAAIARIEGLTDRNVEPASTYWRIKRLVVHAYFTSEVVMKDVLKVQVMPGAFNGSAPHAFGTVTPSDAESAHA
jgi:hypothetical protein